MWKRNVYERKREMWNVLKYVKVKCESEMHKYVEVKNFK